MSTPLTPTERQKRQISRSLRAHELAKQKLDEAARRLKSALKLGAQPGDIFEIKGRGRFTIADNFTKDVAYRPARFVRFTIEEYKEPKAAKTKPSRRKAVAA
jgi:hypothetical protein